MRSKGQRQGERESEPLTDLLERLFSLLVAVMAEATQIVQIAAAHLKGLLTDHTIQPGQIGSVLEDADDRHNVAHRSGDGRKNVM